MNIKILKVSTNELIDARIEAGKKVQLSSIHTGWRFNFDKRSRDTAHSFTYVLVTEEEPDIIEGCLIFQISPAHKLYDIPYLINRKK